MTTLSLICTIRIISILLVNYLNIYQLIHNIMKKKAEAKLEEKPEKKKSIMSGMIDDMTLAEYRENNCKPFSSEKFVIDDEDLRIIEREAGILTRGQIANKLSMSYTTLVNLMKTDPRIEAAYLKGEADTIGFVGGKLLRNIERNCKTSIDKFMTFKGGWLRYYGANAETTSTAPIKFNLGFVGTDGKMLAVTPVENKQAKDT